MTIEIAAAVIFFGLLMIYLGWPLMQVGPAALMTDHHKREDLMVRKNVALAFLKDIELDYKLQKMSLQDYQAIRESALNEGATLLQNLELAQSADWKLRLEEDMKTVGKKGI